MPQQGDVLADAARVAVIAETLGLSEEQIRLDTLSAAAKLGITIVARVWNRLATSATACA